MTPDLGLTDDQREDAATALKVLLGETYALYVKTHGYHWNVTGPRFNQLHAMFQEQYNELWLALDEIAERIRALGHFAPGSSAELLEEATIKPDNGVPNAEDMIANLARGHETVAKAAKAGIEIASEAKDEVTVDLFVQRATISEKTAWMLRSSL
ncbi:MAG: DNA starvation/stationary phase protection protein [Hyphomonadaceae bacterium]|nr:DNA starvation/stationary phase protection protein [Hyphomonadaceae bacterium]